MLAQTQPVASCYLAAYTAVIVVKDAAETEKAHLAEG